MTRDAPALNAACQCIVLDRARLQRQLQANLGEASQLLDARPGLIAGNVVFVDPQDSAAMDRTAALLRQALTSQAFVDHVAQHAPAIARREPDCSGGLLGLDFHLGGATPQLIEINTNPGGLLVNLELARAVMPCCEQIRGPVEELVSGDVPLESVPARVVDTFRAEWRRARGDLPLTTIAIVDDDPVNQYLYPEFLLYQRLFEQAGLRAVIADAAALEINGDRLMAAGTPLDLVYNRVTDFYFREDRHTALREAFERGLAVITPNPASHAHWADKRLLAWLRDETLLQAAGLDDADRAHLLQSIPPTEIVVPDAADRPVAPSQGTVLQAGGRLRQQGGVSRRQADPRDVREHRGRPLRRAGHRADVFTARVGRRCDVGTASRRPRFRRQRRPAAARRATVSRPDDQFPHAGRRLCAGHYPASNRTPALELSPRIPDADLPR